MKTNQNKDYPEEIRLKDLRAHFLRRWKSILLIAVLLAGILGGWQAVRVGNARRDGGKTKAELRYEQDLALYQETTANAEKALADRRSQLEERTAYRDHSLLMNLDPENVWTAERKYLAGGLEEPASAADVLAVYTGAMGTEHDEAALLEAFGTGNAGYAREVVSVESVPGENSFTVKVYAADAEKAGKGMAYVSGKIAEAEKTAQGIAGHTLQVLNEGVSRQVLPELSEKKSVLTDRIGAFEGAVREAERKLRSARESMPGEPGNPVVRWAVAGGILGLLGMLAVYLTTFLRKNGK